MTHKKRKKAAKVPPPRVARFLRVLDDWCSEASLYELSPPLLGYHHVVVSSANQGDHWETSAFACDYDGNVKVWQALTSVDVRSHYELLQGHGYRVDLLRQTQGF